MAKWTHKTRTLSAIDRILRDDEASNNVKLRAIDMALDEADGGEYRSYVYKYHPDKDWLASELFEGCK